MDESIRAGRRVWRKRSPVMRAGTALTAAAGLSLALAACGGPPGTGVAQLGTTTTQGTPSAASSGSGPVSEALAYARCMRAKGVQDFPDPNSSGEFSKPVMSRLATSNPQYASATQTCAHLLPGIGGISPALSQEIANDEAKFVHCMRSRDVPSWPNPVVERGRLVFDPQAVGIDPTSPRIAATLQACDYVFPASVGVPPGAGHNPP